MRTIIDRLRRRSQRVSQPGDRLSLTPTIKDVVFIHIPKTAGTSIRNMLVAAMPDAVKVFDYGDRAKTISGDFIDARATGAETPEGIVALRSRLTRDQRVLLSGHVPASKYLMAFHPASLITFLRDPVDRVVSAYRHYVEHQGFKGSLSDFYRQPRHRNRQSRILWGIDIRTAGFIGLTEHMQDMLPALSRHLNVDLKYRKDNVTGRFRGPTIADDDRSEIRDLNDEDMQLYRHVEANLDRYTHYRGRNHMELTLAKGKVAQRDGVFLGWATAFDPNRLAEIEVRLGGAVVHRCYADQFLRNKPDLSPYGIGGFSVRLPVELLAGHEQVRFLLAGTEKDLDGSPIML